MTSSEVREQILDSLILDLVGPVAGLKAGNYLEQEVLPGSTAPLRWYLTGFLAPFAAKPEEKTDEDSGEQIDLIPPKTGLDDEAAPEAASSRKTPFASSMGLSVLIPVHQSHRDVGRLRSCHEGRSSHRVASYRASGTSALDRPRE
jgi:hypothetical protein